MDIARSGLTASDFIFASASTVITTNSPPIGMTLSQTSVAENSVAGTVVGTFSTSDTDVGDTFTYLLTSNPGNLFRDQRSQANRGRSA